jgi:hypothetical protein
VWPRLITELVLPDGSRREALFGLPGEFLRDRDVERDGLSENLPRLRVPLFGMIREPRTAVAQWSGLCATSAAMVRTARARADHRAPSRVRTTLTGGSAQVLPCHVRRASRNDTLSGSSPSGKSGHSSTDVMPRR